jgi:hypothetical protein
MRATTLRSTRVALSPSEVRPQTRKWGDRNPMRPDLLPIAANQTVVNVSDGSRLCENTNKFGNLEVTLWGSGSE